MFSLNFKLIVISALLLVSHWGYTASPDIKKALLNNNILITGELTISMVDLNNDDIEEAIVRVNPTGYKPPASLQIIILTMGHSDWHIIAKIEDAGLPLIGNTVAASDWLEILSKSPDSPLGKSYNYSSWHYNSQQGHYQKTGHRFSSTTPNGVILMNNDQIKTMNALPVFP